MNESRLPLRAADLYAQGHLVAAARAEADACNRDGYTVTASMLDDLATIAERATELTARPFGQLDERAFYRLREALGA